MPLTARTLNQADGQRRLVPPEEKLDRALVAGLMLEVVLAAPNRPVDPDLRRRQIKTGLTRSLVSHLSGHITLDRFRTLMHRLDSWFQFYYPLMPPLAPAAERSECPLKAAAPAPAGQPSPGLVHRNFLKDWLQKAAGGVLPWRPQRKIHPDGLEEFFQLAQACWFQVKDFARYFHIDRKTAWEYLHRLQDARLLVHNGRRSAAARYRLADNFLKIRVTALEQQLTQLGLPPLLAARVAQGLADTGGDPFWEDRWPVRLEDESRAKVITSLKTAAILEVVCQMGRRRMLRLHREWLYSPD